MLSDVQRFVPTFKGAIKELILKWKSILLVIDISMDLSWICLNVYKYNSDLDNEVPSAPKSVSSPEGISPPDTRVCTTFVDVTNKIEIACKKAVNKEEKTILEKRTEKTMKLLQDIKFPL